MTFATEVAADTPYIWWDTRQISGTSQPDRSGNGRTGTVHGSPSVDMTLGATFNNHSTGDDQWIDADSATAGATIGNFTLEAVCKFTHANQNAAGVYEAIVGFDDSPADSNPLELTKQGAPPSNHFIQGVYNEAGGPGSVGVSSSVQISDEASFHHLVFEYDGTNANLYLDGTLDTATAEPRGLAFAAAVKFILAGDYCGCTDGFGGVLRHGIFYTHAIGATRVAAHYAALSSDPAPGGGPPAPTCSSATPNHGYTTGGDSVVLAGTNLTGAIEVDFGGTPAAGFHVDSDSQITATTPPHAEGTVNVTVTTPGGTSA